MTDSLRNQLLGLGFKPAPAPERKPAERKSSERQPNERAPARDRRPDRTSDRAPGKPGEAPRSRNTDPARGAAAPGRGHPARRGGPGNGAPARRPDAGRGRTREDIDLAKAYAIRAQREKDERIAAEQAKQEEARLRREARAKLA